MSHLRLLTAVVALGLLALPAVAETNIPLRQWVSPIYWSPVAPDPEELGNGRRVPLSARETLASAVPLPFVAIQPCRIADTRDGSYPSGYGPPSLQGGGAARTFVIPSGPCPGIPSNAGAYSLNFTVVAPGGTPPGGYLSVWPAGAPQPVVSTLNFTSGSILANAAIVPAGTGGGINLFVNFSTDLIIDINGYYSGAGVVTSVNALAGDVTLQAGANTSITPTGNTLTIASVGSLTGVTAGTGISVSGGAPSPTVLIPPSGINADRIASGQVVKSVNSFTDGVSIVGSGATTVTNSAGTITIGAPAGAYVLGAPGDSTLIGAGYTEVGASSIEFWSATATSGAPAARFAHTAVWTGTTMIVWGGYNGSTYFNTGGRYNPATNSWTPTSIGANVPAARDWHTAVWTGTEMIVWGGSDGSTSLKTGGKYNPTGNSWTATDSAYAPAARYAHTAVWTGTTMIVWGGNTGATYINTGGIYTPSTNAWADTSVGANVPSGRAGHVAVWTSGLGTPVMVVWGGYDGVAPYPNTGGRFNPAANTWATMGTLPAGRSRPTAVWTGSRMIVWGGADGVGAVSTGGQYDPVGNGWTTTATVGAPSARYDHTAVWTGTKMIVWGGFDGSSTVSSGGVYAPTGNDWTATSGVAAPPARNAHKAVWADGKMIVWGGVGAGYENTGGVYQFLSVFKKN